MEMAKGISLDEDFQPSMPVFLQNDKNMDEEKLIQKLPFTKPSHLSRNICQTEDTYCSPDFRSRQPISKASLNILARLKDSPLSKPVLQEVFYSSTANSPLEDPVKYENKNAKSKDVYSSQDGEVFHEVKENIQEPKKFPFLKKGGGQGKCQGPAKKLKRFKKIDLDARKPKSKINLKNTEDINVPNNALIKHKQPIPSMEPEKGQLIKHSNSQSNLDSRTASSSLILFEEMEKKAATVSFSTAYEEFSSSCSPLLKRSASTSSPENYYFKHRRPNDYNENNLNSAIKVLERLHPFEQLQQDIYPSKGILKKNFSPIFSDSSSNRSSTPARVQFLSNKPRITEFEKVYEETRTDLQEESRMSTYTDDLNQSNILINYSDLQYLENQSLNKYFVHEETLFDDKGNENKITRSVNYQYATLSVKSPQQPNRCVPPQYSSAFPVTKQEAPRSPYANSSQRPLPPMRKKESVQMKPLLVRSQTAPTVASSSAESSQENEILKLRLMANTEKLNKEIKLLEKRNKEYEDNSKKLEEEIAETKKLQEQLKKKSYGGQNRRNHFLAPSGGTRTTASAGSVPKDYIQLYDKVNRLTNENKQCKNKLAVTEKELKEMKIKLRAYSENKKNSDSKEGPTKKYPLSRTTSQPVHKSVSSSSESVNKNVLEKQKVLEDPRTVKPYLNAEDAMQVLIKSSNKDYRIGPKLNEAYVKQTPDALSQNKSSVTPTTNPSNLRNLPELLNSDVKKTVLTDCVIYNVTKKNLIYTVFQNGKIEIKYSNGQIETIFSDGSRSLQSPDNTSTFLKSDGSKEYVSDSGVFTIVKPDGTKISDFSDGYKQIEDCKRITGFFRNGDIKTDFKDGTYPIISKSWYGNGKTTTRYRDGRKESGTGNYYTDELK